MPLSCVSHASLVALVLPLALSVAPASAAMFVSGLDPTTSFTTVFLDDADMNGGFDTATSTSVSPQRNINIPTGQGPLNISFEGIGLNFRGSTSTAVETVSVTIEYLGANGAFGGGDDVVLGTETATMQFLTTQIYTAIFDNPITGLIDGVEDRFRFVISSTGNMRFKGYNAAGSPSGQNGLKISVGGTVTVVPEPGALSLAGLALTAGLRRRRR